MVGVFLVPHDARSNVRARGGARVVDARCAFEVRHRWRKARVEIEVPSDGCEFDLRPLRMPDWSCTIARAYRRWPVGAVAVADQRQFPPTASPACQWCLRRIARITLSLLAGCGTLQVNASPSVPASAQTLLGVRSRRRWLQAVFPSRVRYDLLRHPVGGL